MEKLQRRGKRRGGARDSLLKKLSQRRKARKGINATALSLVRAMHEPTRYLITQQFKNRRKFRAKGARDAKGRIRNSSLEAPAPSGGFGVTSSEDKKSFAPRAQSPARDVKSSIQYARMRILRSTELRYQLRRPCEREGPSDLNLRWILASARMTERIVSYAAFYTLSGLCVFA